MTPNVCVLTSRCFVVGEQHGLGKIQIPVDVILWVFDEIPADVSAATEHQNFARLPLAEQRILAGETGRLQPLLQLRHPGVPVWHAYRRIAPCCNKTTDRQRRNMLRGNIHSPLVLIQPISHLHGDDPCGRDRQLRHEDILVPYGLFIP